MATLSELQLGGRVLDPATGKQFIKTASGFMHIPDVDTLKALEARGLVADINKPNAYIEAPESQLGTIGAPVTLADVQSGKFSLTAQATPTTPTPTTQLPTFTQPQTATTPAPVPSFTPEEGKFYQEQGGYKVYQYKNGKLYHIANPETAIALGVVPKTGENGWVNVEYVSPDKLAAIPKGPKIIGETKPREITPEAEEVETRKPWGAVAETEREKLETEKNLSGIEAKIETASNNIKTFLETKPDSLAEFQKEYDLAGLGKTKSKIEALDTSIAEAKNALNQALTDASGKRIPQWMITGRRRIEVDKANATINNLIDERNSLANQYNTGLNEITVKVGLKQDDTRQEAQNLQNLLDLASGEYERVQARISELLKGKQEAYEGETERLLGIVAAQEKAKAEEEAKAKEQQTKYEKRLAEEVANVYSGLYGTKGAREKAGKILEAEFPGVDVWKGIYTRLPDGYEESITTKKTTTSTTGRTTTGELSDLEWSEEFIKANPGISYEEAFVYLKSYTKMSDSAVKNFLTARGKKPAEEETIPGVE